MLSAKCAVRVSLFNQKPGRVPGGSFNTVGFLDESFDLSAAQVPFTHPSQCVIGKRDLHA